jgi:transposase
VLEPGARRPLVSNQFREIDRSQPITLPGNLEGWLDGNDLAHFIVEVVEVLDTGAIEGEYRGGGSAPYPPKMLLALLFYCYAKGIFTSRKIERHWFSLIVLQVIDFSIRYWK